MVGTAGWCRVVAVSGLAKLKPSLILTESTIGIGEKEHLKFKVPQYSRKSSGDVYLNFLKQHAANNILSLVKTQLWEMI